MVNYLLALWLTGGIWALFYVGGTEYQESCLEEIKQRWPDVPYKTAIRIMIVCTVTLGLLSAFLIATENLDE